MWLLSTDRAELRYFARNFDATGGYAILSHNWNGDEQSLQEVRAIGKRCKENGTNPRDDSALSSKIRECCIIAEKHGYHWVWIDSCCIDKTSSSELSEAINSMFRWYKEAEVCFAYLADVSRSCVLDAHESAFRRSRWHTRGWTLQELIAPDSLIFLSNDWHELGNRADLAGLLKEITGVPVEVLTGADKPAEYSVSIRMSWASRRKTTRVEDEAYSLMGLFCVSIPTNYGEGKHAFIRLQYEIMQHNSDISLFAFGVRHIAPDHSPTFYPEEEVSHRWRYLMADSPREFKYDFGYIPSLGKNAKQPYPPPIALSMASSYPDSRATRTSYGVKLRLPICEVDGITIAVTLCEGGGRHLGLFLTRDSDGIDPNRRRYFTGCVFTQPTTGSAKVLARMVDLGDDLYNLTFNGKPVKASWRTVYVVPTPSDSDFERCTTPDLIINCNPTSSFRIPRWLIARLTTLQFGVSQLPNISETTQTIKVFHPLTGLHISIFLGSCTASEHKDNSHNYNGPLPLWAKVYIVPFTDITTSTHDCAEDHLDSQSWAARSKLFGDKNRAVKLSFIPSALSLENRLSVHLELLGPDFEAILREAGEVSLFPSLADLEADTRRLTRNNRNLVTTSTTFPTASQFRVSRFAGLIDKFLCNSTPVVQIGPSFSTKA